MYIIQDRDQKSSDSVPVGQLTQAAAAAALDIHEKLAALLLW